VAFPKRRGNVNYAGTPGRPAQTGHTFDDLPCLPEKHQQTAVVAAIKKLPPGQPAKELVAR